jgi:hypothetical protein
VSMLIDRVVQFLDVPACLILENSEQILSLSSRFLASADSIAAAEGGA